MAAVDKFHRSDDADAYRKNASFVYSQAYTSAVVGLLDPRPGDKILDLGCGSGELTVEVAKQVAPTGAVYGTDASSDMIQKAKALLETVPDLQDVATFHVLDGHDVAQNLEADKKGTFDKVFSNAALHWMKASPAKVIEGARTALKPHGIFAAEFGGYLNCIGVRSVLHEMCRRRGIDPQPLDPWHFPTVNQYSTLLEKAGFEVKHCELVPRPTPLPSFSGIKGWLRTFGGPFLNAFENDRTRSEVIEEMEEILRPDCYDADEDVWTVMYVRLRFQAVRRN